MYLCDLPISHEPAPYISVYECMYWKKTILPEAGGVNNLHLRDMLLSLFHHFLAICPYRKSSEDLPFLMEQ